MESSKIQMYFVPLMAKTEAHLGTVAIRWKRNDFAYSVDTEGRARDDTKGCTTKSWSVWTGLLWNRKSCKLR